MPLERKPQVLFLRQPVNEPLQTGIKSDAMIPIGRGQRERHW